MLRIAPTTGSECCYFAATENTGLWWPFVNLRKQSMKHANGCQYLRVRHGERIQVGSFWQAGCISPTDFAPSILHVWTAVLRAASTGDNDRLFKASPPSAIFSLLDNEAWS